MSKAIAASCVVHYIAWGKIWDETISLETLRLLPPYTVVADWRSALAVGCSLQSLTVQRQPPHFRKVRRISFLHETGGAGGQGGHH
jgi:hypothetical protein